MTSSLLEGALGPVQLRPNSIEIATYVPREGSVWMDMAFLSLYRTHSVKSAQRE